LPGAEQVEKAGQRLQAAGSEVQDDGETLQVADPSGNRILLTS
jgi:hypothetical protein